MIIDEAYITAPKIIPQKPLIEVVQKMCEKIEPKPIYCELPEDLKLRSIEASGTTLTYTRTTSLAFLSSTSTTTTL